MTSEEKAWAVADAFDAMRRQRKARQKAECSDNFYLADEAAAADKEAVRAVAALLEAMKS